LQEGFQAHRKTIANRHLSALPDVWTCPIIHQ
jgi:hypothetical protein